MDLRPEEMLKAVPGRNRFVTVVDREDGVLVTVPLARRWWVRPPLTWIFPVSSERRVQLDAVGKKVLDLCDGKRTVKDVIGQVQAEHRLSYQEARVATMQFLKMLMERGIVAMVVDAGKRR